ncbi:MAG: CarD family transcriptional regulator [Clostridia bacterium]|nr:CarD family transcriptional regulator [Clostridia bacterium]
MFSIGDYMVYGINGVCLVQDICASPFDKKDTRTFYLLKPLGASSGSVIYTPTDNEQVPMRPLMTRAQAEDLIGRMSKLEPLEIPMEKMRRDLYRQAMHSCDPEQYVRLIKTVYRRRLDMMQQHKRLSETDSDFERNAKLSLYHELSVVLDVKFAEVEQYLTDRLETA